MNRIRLATMASIVALFCLAMGIRSQAQTLTTLYSFSENNSGPEALTQGINGNFYGTTGSSNLCTFAGGGGCGSIFEATPNGVVKNLYSFCPLANCPDGEQPVWGLYLSSSGNFYGATGGGGNSTFPCGSLGGCGTLFKVTSGGVFSSVYKFCAQTNCPDGSNPSVPPTVGTNGNLYGTTGLGGYPNSCSFGCGTVYELTSAGELTTLHDFCRKEPSCADGSGGFGLTLATNGYFYGTTTSKADGDAFAGSFYRMSANGTVTVLYQFCQTNCDDGYAPKPVVQGADGNFYSTTESTFFKVTPTGQLTTLYTFCSQPNCADGRQPNAVILATDGNYYGTTFFGGNQNSNCSPNGCGTLFKITPAGELTTIYSFCSQTNCTDGFAPQSQLTQGTDGNIYGTTAAGGTNCSPAGCGTLFRLSLGLQPFVKAITGFGKAGSVVGILGNGLTGTSSVTFNGVAATFTVVSNTAIKATVPAGATSGPIQVTTPSGVLSSNVAFTVLP